MMRFVLAAVGFALGASGVAAFADDLRNAAENAPAQSTPQTPAPSPAGQATPSDKTPPAPEGAAASNGAQPPADSAHAGDWGMLDKYCVECHNVTDWAGGIAFDTMTQEDVPSEAKVWEQAVRKLRGRLMPPPGKPQPEQQTIDSFVSWMETRLDDAASKHPNPGQVALHRLNRTEYARAVEDLLALKVDPASLLPKDTKSEGFDNVATVLKVSPSFLDQFISAARDVSVLAVGDPAASTSSKVYRANNVSGFSGQSAHVDGLPLGTRGGLLVEHYFPADGQYEFNISTGGGVGYIQGLDHRHKVIMTVDEVKVFEQQLGGPEDLKNADQKQQEAAKAIRERFQHIRLPIKAGSRKIGVAFVARTFAESDDLLQPYIPGSGMDRIPRIGGFEVVGPFNATGVSETPSRKKIFVCRPANESEELPCAKQIVSTLARQAFRRPITDADIEAPMRFYKAGRQAQGFEAGIQQALMAILSSPKFLFRIEAVPASVKPGSVFQVNDLELASRLSFFLWSQGPDATLLDLASQAKLREPGVLDQQVRRMLADPRSKSLITNFAMQWLSADKMDGISPDPSLYPEFDEPLRASFHRETEMFVDSVLRSDKSAVDLLTADYTFVNERLALHYNIPNIRGDQFRRVKLADSHRWGLMGKGSILMGTSYANRTAPVLRGAWILDNITGTPPHAPPPGVEAFKETQPGAKAQTVRERLEQHRAIPSCNSCHGVMDPLGFALENFDAIGQWRTKDRDAGEVIDASGQLPDGTAMKGPDDLRKALTARPQQFVQTLTEKLMIYALGRGIEPHDMPVVRGIVRNAEKDNYRFASIVTGIVKSQPFQMKMMTDPAATPELQTTQATAKR